MTRRSSYDPIDYEPAPEDYTITPCGSLGSMTCVGQVEGGKHSFVGKFSTDRAAERAICAKMDREQFWPSVWWISDHGNVRPYGKLRCPRARKRR